MLSFLGNWWGNNDLNIGINSYTQTTAPVRRAANHFVTLHLFTMVLALSCLVNRQASSWSLVAQGWVRMRWIRETGYQAQPTGPWRSRAKMPQLLRPEGHSTPGYFYGWKRFWVLWWMSLYFELMIEDGWYVSSCPPFQVYIVGRYYHMSLYNLI